MKVQFKMMSSKLLIGLVGIICGVLIPNNTTLLAFSQDTSNRQHELSSIEDQYSPNKVKSKKNLIIKILVETGVGITGLLILFYAKSALSQHKTEIKTKPSNNSDEFPNTKNSLNANKKNESIAVEKDESIVVEIKKNESIASKKDESIASEEDESIAVEKDKSIASEKDKSIAVEKDKSIAGKKDESIAGEKDESIASEEDESIAVEKDKSIIASEKDESIASEKDESIVVEKDESIASKKDESIVVEKDESIASEKDESIVVEKDESIANKKDESIVVEKDESIASEKDESIASEKDESIASKKDESISSEKDENIAVEIEKDESIANKKDESITVEKDKSIASEKGNNKKNNKENASPLKQPDLKPPPKNISALTKEDITAFYEENAAYYDIDQLISKQKEWQLDKDKTALWIEKMKKAWNDLDLTEKQYWIKYWIRSRIPKGSQGKSNQELFKEMEEKNIWELFANEYIERLEKNFITWADFKDRVEQVANDTIEKMQGKKDIYFLVPGSIQKSNTWMFFIFWKYLKDAIPKNAKCHFISHHYSHDSNSEAGLEELLEKTNYRDHTSLILLFDDMAYSGAQMRRQVASFERNKTTVYIIMPYITHQAKRRLTGMDGDNLRSPQNYYNQDYIAGKNPHISNEKMNESTWFKQASIQLMKSTKVVQEILIKHEFLGSTSFTTTPIYLPFKLADHASILTAVIAYSIFPMKEELSYEEVEKFEPVSLLKDHHFEDEEINNIKTHLFNSYQNKKFVDWLPRKKGGEKQKGYTFELDIPREINDSLLPIKAFYKECDFSFRNFKFRNYEKEGEEDEEVNNKENRGIFYILDEIKKRVIIN